MLLCGSLRRHDNSLQLFPYSTQPVPPCLMAPRRSTDRTPALPSRPTGSNPIPPAQRKELTVKQQREERRAAKVAALKKQQAAERRNRRIGIALGSVAIAAVLGLVVTFVVVSSVPAVDPDDITIEGLQTYSDLTANHVEGTVDYEQSPPVGGDHAGAWLN